MGIRPCRECKAPISQQAAVCPQCGAPYPGYPRWYQAGYEWRSQAEVCGIPLVHIAWGRTPEGKLRVAKGIIAIGQFGIGVITIAQFGIGLLFSLGQFSAGCIAVAQFALGIQFGLGQFAVGYTAIGQMGLGHWVLAQMGYGSHVYSTHIHDLAAKAYFSHMPIIQQWLH